MTRKFSISKKEQKKQQMIRIIALAVVALLLLSVVAGFVMTVLAAPAESQTSAAETTAAESTSPESENTSPEAESTNATESWSGETESLPAETVAESESGEALESVGESIPAETNPLVVTPVYPPLEEQEDRLTILLPQSESIREELPLAVRLNPLLAFNANEKLLSGLLYRPLSLLKDSLEYSVLETIRFSEDGKELRITLRTEQYWQDGEPISSRDLVFTLLAMLKNGVSHPLRFLLTKLKGATALQMDPVFNPSPESVGNTKPFADTAGIVSLNDREVLLSFDEDMSSFQNYFLSLPLIPAGVWWQSAPLFWGNDKEMNFDPPASGPYRLQQSAAGSENTDDAPADPGLLFLSESGEGFAEAEIAKISVQFAPSANMTEALRSSRADLAVMESLTAEEQALLKEDGYTVDVTDGEDVYTYSVNTEMQENPLLSAKVRLALSMLFPGLNELDPAVASALLPTADRMLAQDKAFLPEELAAVPIPENEEERREAALDLLLEEGFYTVETAQEKLDRLMENKPDMDIRSFPALYLAYSSQDPLLAELSLAYASVLQKAGITLYTFPMQNESISARGEDAQYVHLFLTRNSRWQQDPVWLNRPLFFPATYLVHKRVQHFRPSYPDLFAEAARWTLP